MSDIEICADPIDSASNFTLAETEQTIRQHRNKMKPDQVKSPDGTWPVTECQDCGETIPLARLEATGSIYCVECKSIRG